MLAAAAMATGGAPPRLRPCVARWPGRGGRGRISPAVVSCAAEQEQQPPWHEDEEEEEPWREEEEKPWLAACE
jgi:hypothetical protein